MKTVVVRTNSRFIPKVALKFHINKAIHLPALFQQPKTTGGGIIAHSTCPKGNYVLLGKNKRPLKRTGFVFVFFAHARIGLLVLKEIS